METPLSPTAADYRACLVEPARAVPTSCGPMEVADRGQGPPLLSLHGSPAAYRNGLLAAEFARVGGFRVIAPSRPGYGATPLSTGSSPAEHADALAALLDALELDQVALLATSGGGPAGYALAGQHPDRVSRLVQVDGIALPIAPPRGARLGLRLRPLPAVAAWLLDRFPTRMLAALGAPPTSDPVLQAAQAALARGIITTAAGWQRLGAGWDNEAAHMRTLDPLPLATITCPALIVHARADIRIPVGHAEHAHAAIRHSELRWIDGGHLAFIFSPAAQHDAVAWLRRQDGGT